jgi:uncharacterized protein (TIGR00730 family)
MKRICVYCGSALGCDPDLAETASAFGRLLGQRGLGLVYGGGNTGLMGRLADAALAAGAEVIGVMPRHMLAREVGHGGLTRLIEVEDMHERKRTMAELADAFVALPGGIGTLEELFEIFTWRQLDLHAKPVGLLNAHGFYDHLLQFMAHVVGSGFLRPEQWSALHVAADPVDLLGLLRHRGAR